MNFSRVKGGSIGGCCSTWCPCNPCSVELQMLFSAQGRCRVFFCTTVQDSTLPCPACFVARHLPQRWSFHQFFLSHLCDLLRAEAKQVLPPQHSLCSLPSLTGPCCLQRQKTQVVVIPAVKALLRFKASLSAKEHLKAMLLRADHRSSDVHLRTGLAPDGSTQLAPHTAFAWRWSADLKYHWRAEQHINVLELTGLLIYLRFAYRYRSSARREDFPDFW